MKNFLKSLFPVLIVFTLVAAAPILSNLQFPDQPLSTGVISSLPHVADNTTLASKSIATYPNGVWRDDFSVGRFLPETGTCAANSLINDGVSCVNTTAGDGNSWYNAGAGALTISNGSDGVLFTNNGDNHIIIQDAHGSTAKSLVNLNRGAFSLSPDTYGDRTSFFSTFPGTVTFQGVSTAALADTNIEILRPGGTTTLEAHFIVTRCAGITTGCLGEEHLAIGTHQAGPYYTFFQTLTAGGLLRPVVFAMGNLANPIFTLNTDNTITFGTSGLISPSVSFPGSSSGTAVLTGPASGGGTITLPTGTTDFSATGGTSQFLKQASAAGPITVAQPTFADIGSGTTVATATGLTCNSCTLGSTALGGSGSITSGGTLNIGGVGTAQLFITGSVSQAAWTTSGLVLRESGGTYTDTTSSGTVAEVTLNNLGGNPTLAASSPTVYTQAENLRIGGTPAAGTNVTITNALGLYLTGAMRVDGLLKFGGNSTSTPALTHAGTTLKAVLSDNSADAPFEALSYTANGNAGFSGTLILNTANMTTGCTVVVTGGVITSHTGPC